jgi:hypothetical protein
MEKKFYLWVDLLSTRRRNSFPEYGNYIPVAPRSIISNIDTKMLEVILYSTVSWKKEKFIQLEPSIFSASWLPLPLSIYRFPLGLQFPMIESIAIRLIERDGDPSREAPNTGFLLLK